jgi:hypothetical protein
MNDYVIGSGAVLTAGPAGSIAAATLHAQTDVAIASGVSAAVVDFESPSADDLSKIVIVASRWTASRANRELIEPLLARSTATLADVIELLGRSTGAEVHLFARWLPDELLAASLRRAGVTLICHALEDIRQAALISGQRYTRWPSLRAA